MIVSFFRISVVVFAMILLFSTLALPVWASQTGEVEIIVREDAQLLQRVCQSAVPGLGAAVCMAVIFRIVWKQREP